MNESVQKSLKIANKNNCNLKNLWNTYFLQIKVLFNFRFLKDKIIHLKITL